MPRQVKPYGDMTSDEWCSPLTITEPLHELFHGRRWCDPCSNSRSVVGAPVAYTFGGLQRRWLDESYANWPYSKNEVWSAKAIYEMRVQRVHELVILCMTATSTIWWQSLMLKPRRNPRVIATKRIKFLGPDGKPVDSSRFEPALIYYGPQERKFDRLYKHVAMWSTRGR